MKVRIYQNQPVPENPALIVLASTGDYGPFDLIPCGEASNGVATAAFQAQFLKFGGLVYREQEYIEVLSNLGLVDLRPDTLSDMLTGDKTSIVIDRNPLDNLPEEIVQESQTAPEIVADQYATTTDPVIQDNLPGEEAVNPSPLTEDATSTPAAPVIDATSTEDFSLTTSSSTQPLIDETITTATSTP